MAFVEMDPRERLAMRFMRYTRQLQDYCYWAQQKQWKLRPDHTPSELWAAFASALGTFSGVLFFQFQIRGIGD